MNQIKQYIKFLLKSTNQHGVHSPFVYNLVTKCFYDNTKHEAYKNILAYKKQLLKSKEKITVNNIGDGILDNKTRLVSDIAKNTLITKNQAKLLYKLTAYFNFETILELGTSLGIATHAMHLGNPTAHIISFDGCPNISAFTRANFKKKSLKNTLFVHGTMAEILKNASENAYDFLLFTKTYQNEITLKQLETLIQSATNSTVFMFSGIHSNKRMTEIWEFIKHHSKVTVSIDIFFCGLVFFRKEQAKEHFVIRV